MAVNQTTTRTILSREAGDDTQTKSNTKTTHTGGTKKMTKGILHSSLRYPSSTTTKKKTNTPSPRTMRPGAVMMDNNDEYHNDEYYQNRNDENPVYDTDRRRFPLYDMSPNRKRAIILRRKRVTTTIRSTTTIPENYVDIILRGYGEGVDLCRDILKVSSDADAQQLRIGYFRQGRQILTEDEEGMIDVFVAAAAATTTTPNTARNIELNNNTCLSEGAKNKFQAVSVAYEILSTPELRRVYDQDGLCHSRQFYQQRTRISLEEDDDDDSSRRVRRVITPPSRGPRPTVRWNEEVEELVYERDSHHSEEATMEWTNDDDDDKSKRKQKKTKPRILIDQGRDEHLDEYLAQLDAEAEIHFAPDFLDKIEESIGGLLRLAGKKKKKEKKNKKNPDIVSIEDFENDHDDLDRNYVIDRGDDDNNDEHSLEEAEGPTVVPIQKVVACSTSGTSCDDDSLVGYLASYLRRLHKGGGSKNRHESPSEASFVVPLSRNEAESPFRCISPEPPRSISPENDQVNDVLSGSVIPSTKKGDEHNFVDDDLFDGIEDENTVGREPISIPRSCSVSNISPVSDLSESVLTARERSGRSSPFVVTPTTRSDMGDDQHNGATSTYSVSSSVAREIFDVGPEDNFFPNNDWYQRSNITRSLSLRSIDGNKESDEVAVVVTPDKTVVTGEKDDSGFLGALAGFFNDMATECATVGKNLTDMWKIGETDVDQLSRIVTKEINEVPRMKKDSVPKVPSSN